jgi:hypothetical protein
MAHGNHFPKVRLDKIFLLAVYLLLEMAVEEVTFSYFDQ